MTHYDTLLTKVFFVDMKRALIPSRLLKFFTNIVLYVGCTGTTGVTLRARCGNFTLLVGVDVRRRVDILHLASRLGRFTTLWDLYLPKRAVFAVFSRDRVVYS